MTLRRLRWLLVPLVAAAALAVMALPPRPLPQQFVLIAAFLGFGSNAWREDFQAAHRQALIASRDRLRETIAARAHGAADVRASHDARALHSTREPVAVVRDADVPDSVARRWLALAEREIGFLPKAPGGGVPVIVALHTRDPRTGVTEVVGYSFAERFQYVSGVDRACIVDIVFPRKGEPGQGRFAVSGWLKGDVVGRCGLYARYGLPGPGVGRWAGLGVRWNREWAWSGIAWLLRPPRGAPDTVAWRNPYGGEVPWVALSCLRGSATNCEEISGLSRSPFMRRDDLYDTSGGWSNLGSRRIVTALLTQRGPERFARFWTSPVPVDTALRAAYGAPAGEVLSEVLSQRMVPAPLAQPRVASFVVAFGWVLVLAGVAMGLSWRREMDA